MEQSDGTVVFLVRHAQSSHNAAGRISTRGPGPRLTDEGRAQAQTFAYRFASRGVEQVCSSGFIRARETATIVAEVLRTPPDTVEADLRELDAGELDGRNDPAAYVALNAALHAWQHDYLSVRIGSTGEIGTDVVRRVRRALAQIARAHPGRSVVAVTHGGIMETIVPIVSTNLPTGFRSGEHLDNCAVVELVVDTTGETRCRSWDGSPIPVGW